MSHLVSALFFTLALLAAAVAIHMTVRFHWHEILAALGGGADGVRRPAARPVFAAQRRAAA